MHRTPLMTAAVSVAASLLAACSSAGVSGTSPAPVAVGPLSSRLLSERSGRAATMPKNVIVIVQENRTVDNLFQFFPGANTVNKGPTHNGGTQMLQPISMDTAMDCGHFHGNFVTELNGGAQNGFDLESCSGSAPPLAAYSYVPQKEVQPYYDLAAQYTFANNVMQPNEGPSFPGHIYLIAGQTGDGFSTGVPGDWYVADNGPFSQSGCNFTTKDVPQINMALPYPGLPEGNKIAPCIDPPTVLSELDKAGVSWKWYTPSTSIIWTSPYAIKTLYNNDKAKVIVPETTILTDIMGGVKGNKLAQLSFVVPTGHNSDHPGKGNDGGPGWVCSIVNTLGASTYWNQSAVIVVWDDWGGFYDHVPARHPATNPGDPMNSSDPYEYGFRVPLLAIGPTAKLAYIGPHARDSTAITHFIEDIFGVGSLNKLDAQTDDLFNLFNFGGPLHQHKPVNCGPITIQGLLMERPDPQPVDSE